MTLNSALSNALTPIINNIVEPALLLLFAVAFVYFVWGIYKLIQGADNPDERSVGRWHILSSCIGMFIMLCAYAIIRVIANTLNVSSPV